MLGPLTNPAGARAQVVGVYAPELVRTIAEVLARLGARRAFVVHGAAGIDELSPAGPNLVGEVVDGDVRERMIDPLELGVPRCDPAELVGGGPAENAARIRAIFEGAENAGAKSAILLNAAGAIAAGGHAADLREGLGYAREALESGAAADEARAARRLLARGGGRVRFRDALAAPGLGAIAEIKRRSPSAGELRGDADPALLAAQFTDNGASALSVLVDDRFGGSLDDLRAARAATELPLLGKGFFTEEADLAELKAAGADAALILLRDVDDTRARALLAEARRLGLDALVEAHDAEELERAIALDAEIVGVNARDLGSFAIDRRTQLELVARVPRDRVVVAESGVHTRAQGAAAELAGANAILVGTALMRASDPGAKLAELISRPLVKVCGLTREEDVAVAVDAGADLVGFILARETPRRAPRVLDVPDTVLSVAVFVEDVDETPADLVQLYERENGHRGKDAVLLREGLEVARVVDLPWETEDPDHIARAASLDGRVMLAGGLSPDNVRAAIDAVRPWAVDASSSLESAPGIKDEAKVRAFVEAARC